MNKKFYFVCGVYTVPKYNVHNIQVKLSKAIISVKIVEFEKSLGFTEANNNRFIKKVISRKTILY